MKRLLLGSAACLLFPCVLLASPWQSKPVGVLLVSELGGGDWNHFVKNARKSLGKEIPLQTFTGALGTRGLQRAVTRLEADKVERIVVIPVFLESTTPEFIQLQYLFGANLYPSKAFLEKWGMGSRVVKRVKSKIPIVITNGLDGHEAVGRTLLERAQDMSRTPKKEMVILIGSGVADEQENSLLAARLNSLAGNVAIRGGFSSARGFLVRPNAEKKPRQHEESIQILRKAIREASKRNRVIVVPYLLLDDGSVRAWRKRLDNMFFRWKGKTLMPNDAMHAWLKVRIDAAREAENMVRFKDDGKPLPSARRKSRINP
ncbi:MAG: hypothetical protein COB53_01880 [Elusimicrobia bacterium]|nr:MAG: hypothetical protein COB53_01880 [Elusimicrobiota bacterium]